MILTRDGTRESPWTVQRPDADTPTDETAAIRPLAAYLADPTAGNGVWLAPDDEADVLVPWLDRLQVIALDFPAFNDGRAYSSANILRRQHGYKGELRAIGDVRRDQLEQMVRCGFDAFELAPGQDAAAALASLAGFSVNYQDSIDRPHPLFRQRTR